MAGAQSTRTCSIDGCEKPYYAKSWCQYHYKRAYATGDPLTPPRPTSKPKPDAAFRRMCAVDGCETLVGRGGARGYCPTHYSRWQEKGDPGPAHRLTTSRNGVCKVTGCDRPIRSTGLCGSHKSRLDETGSVNLVCLYCGSDMTNKVRARLFCCRAHAAMYHRHGGSRPMERDCMRCGSPFSLLSTSKTGRTKRSDAKMCPACRKARMTRHGWSPVALVAHYGSADCGICGEAVDLSLRKPDLMSASVDHIIPFAHGGSNDISNLQLAHLHCNHVKSDSGYKRGRRVNVLEV